MLRSARVAREGFLLFDKPKGWSSNRCLQEVKRRLQAVKGGHTGSLDPLATGLLPLCFGHATRVSQFLLEADKTYEAVLRLGVETDTYDAEGRVTAECAVAVETADIERALGEFRGTLQQVPPMYSAIKMDGAPLYRRARAGEEVVRAPRTVHIRSYELMARDADRLQVRVVCSKGTYIRSLAYDLGRRLGCGAHVEELRRTGVGGFAIAEAVTLEQVEQACAADEVSALLRPADQALAHLPATELGQADVARVRTGQRIAVSRLAEGWVRMYGTESGFLGLGWWADGVLHPKRVWSATAVG